MMNKPGSLLFSMNISWRDVIMKSLVVILVIGLIGLPSLSTGLAKSMDNDQAKSILQLDTPTPTATSTSTATPTLAPVSLSFQNGVFPSPTYTGTQDTYISESDPFGNFGQSSELKINGETSPGVSDANHSLLKWDISQIPPGSEILSASLTFNVITNTVDAYPVYQLLKPWVFNQATWINYAGGFAWEIAGASGPTDRGSQILTGFAPATSGPYMINLNRSVVQFWVDNPSQNYGLIISNGNGSSQAVIDSAEASTPSNRPKLSIEFIYPPGTTPTPTLPAIPAAPTNLTATAVSTSQINLSWTDNSNNETGFQIERSTDNINWTLVNTTGPDITSFSDTGLAINTTYYYRVRATGIGGNSDYSNVASASTTPTVTPSPTVSGTPPTPTVTGTIVPNIVIQKTVSPAQASIGQLFNFTIQITNSSLSAATEAVLVDTFPSVLTITGAQTNKGTYSINTQVNTITFNIGSIATNEVVRVGILAQVNTTATTNTNYNNTATLNFKFLNVNQSRSSNTVTYRVLGTTTLPGTGLSAPNDNSFPIIQVLIWLAVVLALLGLGAFVASFWSSRNLTEWTGWFVRTGIIFLGAALIFGLLVFGLSNPADKNNSQANATALDQPITSSIAEQPNENIVFLAPTLTPANLPDYVIPSPTLDATTEEDADTSPIEQIFIPSLGVDTIVKYVPFDGSSWAIAGLKQEVAWMGDTSWPGLGKNTALAGHVTLADGSDGPFRDLGDLLPGELVVLETQENIYTYKVREQVVVQDSDLSVIKETENPQLTLITCSNWDNNIRIYLSRLVIYADLEKVEPIVTAQLDY